VWFLLYKEAGAEKQDKLCRNKIREDGRAKVYETKGKKIILKGR